MRVLASSLLGACVVGVFAACSAAPSDGVGPTSDTRQPEIATLAFIVWNCADLECLNLETSETANHSYTACSAVLEDAENVGIDICETRKRGSSVVSKPAKCTPLGTACPNARAAYNWDDTNKRRVEDDAGADPAPDPDPDAGDP